MNQTSLFESKSPEWRRWQWQLANAVRDVGPLIDRLALSPEEQCVVKRTAQRYPVLVTPYYLSLVKEWDLHDPILRQCFPDGRELAEGDSPDPLAEERDSAIPHLIHRYPDRALLICTNTCAIHCRHCMRKRYWGMGDRTLSPTEISRAVEYVKANPEIREVILSGGDPLLLPEALLLDMLDRFRRIPHIELIRLGSRVPTVLPQRLTQQFCAALGQFSPLWLATHFNHPGELTPASQAAAENLLRAGIPVVNQTVLLKGINDDPDTMGELCQALLRQRIKPYYLFHGDPVAGTMHFRTGLRRGKEIMAQLLKRMSGLAVPHFAYDLPDGAGKVRLLPDP